MLCQLSYGRRVEGAGCYPAPGGGSIPAGSGEIGPTWDIPDVGILGHFALCFGSTPDHDHRDRRRPPRQA